MTRPELKEPIAGNRTRMDTPRANPKAIAFSHEVPFMGECQAIQQELAMELPALHRAPPTAEAIKAARKSSAARGCPRKSHLLY